MQQGRAELWNVESYRLEPTRKTVTGTGPQCHRCLGIVTCFHKSCRRVYHPLDLMLAMPTHFNWAVDGSIVGIYLLATMVAGIMVRRYVGKVEDFLVAGREMNVYLGIASLAATEFGIVTCMYTAQNGYAKGFSGSSVGICTAIGMFLVGWTGFCIKPLRDSGVMTIPQLFRTRYGPG